MNLLIDSGNSFIKWALATEQSLVIERRCLSSAAPGLHEIWKNYDVPNRVIVANVAGEKVASEIRMAVSALWKLDAEYIVSKQSCCGLTNSYHKPEQLGVDRWMAMVAAYRMAQDPVIVVDCGTAVTIDLVNEKGVFLGGAIMPGLNVAIKSLRESTNTIDEVSSIDRIVISAAQSTEEGVAAGVLYGLAGGVERVVSEQSSIIDKAPKVFITGGDAKVLMPYLTILATLQTNLVMQGLRIFTGYNSVA